MEINTKMHLRYLICRVYQSEELEIQYPQALAKPKRETISHNSLLEALTFKETRIYRYNPLDRNIYSTTNLVHRTTVTHVKVINASLVSDHFIRLLLPYLLI